MNLQTQKQIRAQVLALRKALTVSQQSQKSQAVVQNFIQSWIKLPSIERKALNIGLYQSLRGEVDLGPLAEFFRSQGAALHYPRVVVSEAHSREIEFVDMTQAFSGSFPNAWKTGSFGILEPELSFPPVVPASLDLIFVPGVAFGEAGERIGMGVGYYDRFLPQAPRALRVALAFDFQVFPRLMQNTHDQSVHAIWTESREIKVDLFENQFRNVWSMRGP